MKFKETVRKLIDELIEFGKSIPETKLVKAVNKFWKDAKNRKYVFWIVAVIVILLLAGVIYRYVRKQAESED